MSLFTPHFDAGITPNGNLDVEADRDTRHWIIEQIRAGRSYDEILHAGFEAHWANGGYQPFDAGRGNPMVGLTDAPCIAECLDRDENGQCHIVGRFWWFPNYMVVDPVELLLLDGHCFFELGGTS